MQANDCLCCRYFCCDVVVFVVVIVAFVVVVFVFVVWRGQCVASNQKCPGDSPGCKLIDRVLPNMHRNGNSQKMDLLRIFF